MNTLIEVKDLCKTYVANKRQNHVLRNVNFNIKKGEFISVMGPSGSGKSTLLYSVSGMDKMTAGSVIFDGQELSGLNENQMAGLRLNKMGFIFQHIYLLKNLGIMDNVIVSAYMAKKKSRKEVNADAATLLKRTGIIKLADNDITQASGGELQRAAICRALINNPEILFADEPTGALNSKSATEIMELMLNINNTGTTIMIVTHDSKVAAKTERVLYMVDGNIKGEYHLGKFSGKETDNKEREINLSKWLFDMGW